MSEVASATFGGGCFWCTEAVFLRVPGVQSVMPGYAGGSVANPSYEEVCGKKTGHAEVIRVEYEPDRVSFRQLLEIFFGTHDPTTKDRQGNDVGPQYRSVVFCHDDEQRAVAEGVIRELDASGAFNAPIVTEVADAATFYPAEDYHRDYFARNPQNPYCQFVIVPKIEKFKAVFEDGATS